MFLSVENALENFTDDELNTIIDKALSEKTLREKMNEAFNYATELIRLCEAYGFTLEAVSSETGELIGISDSIFVYPH